MIKIICSETLNVLINSMNAFPNNNSNKNISKIIDPSVSVIAFDQFLIAFNIIMYSPFLKKGSHSRPFFKI